MKVLTEKQILTQLNEVINSIKQNPQINVVGIKNELEAMVKPKSKIPIFDGKIPQIYTDLKGYYDYLCGFIYRREEHMGPNQSGALSKLEEIRDNYSKQKHI